MCTNKGVFLTSLGPNPDGKPESRKIKQVCKIYDNKVKFMQLYKQILFIVGSEVNIETADFSAKQLTIMQEKNSQILARLKFNEEIIFFKIQATILIVSAGGGLYIFDMQTFKKLESLQCNSTFGTYMSTMKNDDSKVDIFRIVYTDPSSEGRLNIFSCKFVCPHSSQM